VCFQPDQSRSARAATAKPSTQPSLVIRFITN
jgi:hypothetical protein